MVCLWVGWPIALLGQGSCKNSGGVALSPYATMTIPARVPLGMSGAVLPVCPGCSGRATAQCTRCSVDRDCLSGFGGKFQILRWRASLEEALSATHICPLPDL